MSEESRPRTCGLRPEPNRRGGPYAGLHFYVWDEDARVAALWAAQLADVERSVEARRPAAPQSRV
jgi:hypothetical protein